MRILLILFTALILSCSGSSGQESEPEWQSLFNGVDLEGWTVKIRGFESGDNWGNTFRVEDSLLTVSYDEYDSFNNRFGHIFYQHPFNSYRLRVEYRFIGDQLPDGPGWAYRNSGIMVHSQSAESMGKDQDFPVSIEVQLLGGNGTDDRSTCNLCTPGTNVVYEGELDTRHCISSSSATYHGDQWVMAEVRVYGDSLIEHYVNDTLVLTYKDPQLGGGNVSGHIPDLFREGELLSGGYISLQSESHPVQFRRVEIAITN